MDKQRNAIENELENFYKIENEIYTNILLQDEINKNFNNENIDEIIDKYNKISEDLMNERIDDINNINNNINNIKKIENKNQEINDNLLIITYNINKLKENFINKLIKENINENTIKTFENKFNKYKYKILQNIMTKKNINKDYIINNTNIENEFNKIKNKIIKDNNEKLKELNKYNNEIEEENKKLNKILSDIQEDNYKKGLVIINNMFNENNK